MQSIALTDQLFNVSEISLRDDRVYICLSVPAEAYSQIPKFLDCLDFFYRLSSRQIKVQAALDRAIDPVAIEQRATSFKSYCDDIFLLYDDLISKGSSPREAYKKVKIYSEQRGKYITCTSIEMLIRKSGRLRKSWSSVSVH